MFLECMDFWTEFDFVVEVRISLVFSEGGGYTRKDCSVLPLCSWLNSNLNKDMIQLPSGKLT